MQVGRQASGQAGMQRAYRGLPNTLDTDEKARRTWRVQPRGTLDPTRKCRLITTPQSCTQSTLHLYTVPRITARSRADMDAVGARSRAVEGGATPVCGPPTWV